MPEGVAGLPSLVEDLDDFVEDPCLLEMPTRTWEMETILRTP